MVHQAKMRRILTLDIDVINFSKEVTISHRNQGKFELQSLRNHVDGTHGVQFLVKQSAADLGEAYSPYA